MTGAPQAGYRNSCAAIATVALLWLAAPPAAADEVDARALDAAFDVCLADPHIASAREHPESIQWDAQPQPSVPARRKQRKKRGAETALHDDVRLYCPELYSAIDRSAFAVMLPADWGERATRRKLQRLRALMLAEAARPAGRLDPAGVPGILREIETAQAVQELSLWQKFKAWLEKILRRNADEKKSSWFSDWLKAHRPSEEVMTRIGYGLLILLVAGAFWIVYSELRAAGMLGRRSRQRKSARVDALARSAAPPVKSLANAGDEDQPALLITLLLEQMRRLGRIQDRLSMTHRELASAAHFDSPDDRETFSSLVSVAEKLRYAAIAPARVQLRQSIESAKLLLSRLLHPPRSAA